MEATISIVTFLAVIGLIISDKLNPMLVAMLGILILLFTKVLSLQQAADHIATASSTLILFFGAMVMVSVVETTGIFSKLARGLLLMAHLQGKRLLLAVVMLTGLLSAFLPNAVVVLLLGPTIITLTRCLALESGPFLVLLVLAANTGGLFTLVGDPATYIVGQGANYSFFSYLHKITPGGLIALLALLLALPWKWRKIWNCQLTTFDIATLAGSNLHPKTRQLLFFIGSGLLLLILFGKIFSLPFSPDVVALAGATLTLILGERFGLSSVKKTLATIDWGTILFFAAMFVLTGALEDAGVLEQIAGLLRKPMELNPPLAKILLLWGVAFLSSIAPNIPLLAALTPILLSLDQGQDGQILYAAMLYGATLGGNATLTGASANIVASGIGAQADQKISFSFFLSYGLPVSFLQLAAVTLWLML